VLSRLRAPIASDRPEAEAKQEQYKPHSSYDNYDSYNIFAR
jgi:hypothetical protein